MAVNIDWRLNQPVDIAGNAMQGYQAGRTARRERDTENALHTYAETGDSGPLVAADPRTGLAFRQADRQTAAQIRQETQQQQDRDRARAAALYTGLQDVPEAQRRQVALSQVSQMGLSPEETQRITTVFNDPNTRWDDGSLSLYARTAGGDPNAGAITLHPNDVYGRPGGPVLATGASEPVINGSFWHTPTLPAVGSRFGAGSPATGAPSGPTPAPAGVSTPPAAAQPQEGAPEGQDQASGFNRDMMARLLIGEGVQGPGQVAVANVVFNRAHALGVSPDQIITAPHQFEPYGNHTRWQELQTIPTTDPRYQAALQAIDQASQQDITNGATHFYSPAIMAGRGGPPTWARGHEGQDIGGNTFLRLPFGPQGAGQGGSQPAPAPAGQTAPDAGDAGAPPGWHRLPAAPAPQPAQGHPVTPAEHALYPGAVAMNEHNLPVYPPASATAASPSLSTASIENYARQAILDPSIIRSVAGQGAAGNANRVAIANRATEIQNETGLSGADAVVAHFGVRAAASTLRQQTQLRSNVAGFEQTFEQNATLALSIARRGGAAGSLPVFNRWIQAGRVATGDRDVAALDASLRTVASEYAKISEGNTGSGGSSVESRRAAEELLNRAQTIGQLESTVTVMRADNAHRLSGLNTQIDNLTSSIRHAGGGAFAEGAASAGSTPAPPALGSPGATGRFSMGATSGSRRPAQASPARAAPSAPGLPAAAARALQEGHNTTFGNGQVWTLRGGRATRVR